jgi:TPR repeat protein
MKSNNSKSAKDYFIRIAMMSGKDGDRWLPLSAKNENNYTDRRIALVMGNSNYSYHSQLRNPLNDATAVAEQLQQLGFEVICLYDVTKDAMVNALDLFRQKAVKEQYDFALFYYSGHGLQYDGKNWLMPVETKLERPSDLKAGCMEGQELLSLIEDTRCANKIVILDACRTEKINWKEQDETQKEIDSKGFVSMEPRRGMLLAYSTRSGDIAQDMSEDGLDIGPYASALVSSLQKENLLLDDLFNEVETRVEEMTSFAQSPIHTNGIRGKWIINGKNVFVPKVAYGQQESSSDFLAFIREKAEAGDRDAQFQLGTCYEYGVSNVSRDYAMAVQWYEKAAKQKHDEALNKMGTYQFMNENYKQALKLYKSAAKAGNLNAQHNLGMMYTSDRYGVMDVPRGVKWYKSAANAGNMAAQFEMGICHYYGIGVVKNSANAIPWFEMAARQGHDEAQYMLAQCYLMGDGVFQNYKEAFKYFQMAADQNYAPAQYGLCTCYYDGLGVKQDMGNAAYWCKKAAEQGYKKAINRMQFLKSDE